MARMHRDDTLTLIIHYEFMGDFPLVEALRKAKSQRDNRPPSTPSEVVKATLVHYASKYRHLGLELISVDPKHKFVGASYIDKLTFGVGTYTLHGSLFMLKIALTESTIILNVSGRYGTRSDQFVFKATPPYDILISNYRTPPTPQTLTVELFVGRVQELYEQANYY